MKTARLGLICLLAGLAMSIALALICLGVAGLPGTARPPPAAPRLETPEAPDLAFLSHVGADPSQLTTYSIWDAWGVQLRAYEGRSQGDLERLRQLVLEHPSRYFAFATRPVSGCVLRCGWPYPAFERIYVDGDWQTGAGATGAVDLKPRSVLGLTFPALLPTSVLVGGLSLDTLFLGAILLTGVVAIHLARRRWRLRHGHCIACGYESGLNPRCPECGLVADLRQTT